MTTRTLIGLEELQQFRAACKNDMVGFVPTMGALHDGHLSLVKLARKHAQKVIVSIFVNPLQFGPKEDFSKYPRMLKADVERLASVGVDAVFAPNVADMYPSDFQTRVLNVEMAADLCGASRPGHFEGVLTVVCRLLSLVAPHVAVFGKKDYQQYRLIQQMASDLALPVQILGGEIVRDPDGLAMSSRNAYLSAEERQQALALSKGLQAAATLFRDGERQPEVLLNSCYQAISSETGIQPEYCELRDQKYLRAFAEEVDAPAVLLVAARVGSTRLIDNMELTV